MILVWPSPWYTALQCGKSNLHFCISCMTRWRSFIDAEVQAYDVCVEATGSSKGILLALELTRPMGTIVQKSTCSAINDRQMPQWSHIATDVVVNEKRLVGSRYVIASFHFSTLPYENCTTVKWIRRDIEMQRFRFICPHENAKIREWRRLCCLETMFENSFGSCPKNSSG